MKHGFSNPAIHTEICECGGKMKLSHSETYYSWDDFGHYKDKKETYKCGKCGKTRTITPHTPCASCLPHTFNSYNICTVCGYDRGD